MKYSSKVFGTSVVALLNRTPRTPRFDWPMARLVVKNRHQKDMCSDVTFYTQALKPPVIHGILSYH